MSTVVELVERITSKRNQDGSEKPEHTRETEQEEWKENMQSILRSCRALTAAMREGLTHVTLLLRLGAVRPQPEAHGSRSDLEKASGKVEPGSTGFYESLEITIKECLEEQRASLQRCHQANSPTNPEVTRSNVQTKGNRPRSRSDALFLAIYVCQRQYSPFDIQYI